MGLFDTFLFDTPVPCGHCGAEITSVQSKRFDCALDTYHSGDLVRDRALLLGIVQEDCFCDACKCGDAGTEVYIVIWHGVYAGAYPNRAEAEYRLASVDRLDLIHWLDRQQQSRDYWRRRYRALYADMEAWQRYSDADDKQDFLASRFGTMHSGLVEYLKDKDPFGALVEANRIKPGETGGEDGDLS